MCHSYLVENISEEFVLTLKPQYWSIWYRATYQAGGAVPLGLVFGRCWFRISAGTSAFLVFRYLT